MKTITAILISLLCASILNAEVYKYKDKSGVYHYVNNPHSIPEEYRPKDLQPHELPQLIKENKSNPKKRIASRRNNNARSVADIERELAELNKYSNLDANEQSTTGLDSNSRRSETYVSITTAEDSTGFVWGIVAIGLAIVLINLVAYGILLERANMPGWAIIIPIYNCILMSRLAGKSGWWILWNFVPIIGVLVWQLSVGFLIAKNFQRGDLFAIGTAIVPFIFIPILAFSRES